MIWPITLSSIQFREDNTNNPEAASLRYSLPVKFQSEVLHQQITAFREYRRQRFSLFRRGPLVEETTVTNNLRSLLRFLGYLHFEQQTTVQDTPLNMSVFALPNISSLVLNYVEWLEQRRGRKQQAADDTLFQPVSCSTLANYLNGLINIVKFQLCDSISAWTTDVRPRPSTLVNLRTVMAGRCSCISGSWCCCVSLPSALRHAAPSSVSCSGTRLWC
jgi:hypothetical protein